MKNFTELFFTPFKSMSEHIKYRISNPLGIAFVFSWIIFNWQAVYYFMFSDDKASVKITYLQKIYVTDAGYDLSDLFWCPLGAAILYLIIAPIISNIATGLWSVIDKSCTTIRLSIVEKRTILTEGDRDNMYRAFSSVRDQYSKRIAELEKEIAGYRNIITLDEESKGVIDNKIKTEQGMSVIETPKTPEYRDSDTGDILVDGNIYNELHSLPNDDYVYESDDSISDDADTNKPITYVRKYLVLNEWLNEKIFISDDSKHDIEYRSAAIRYLNTFLDGSPTTVYIDDATNSKNVASRSVIKDFITSNIITLNGNDGKTYIINNSIKFEIDNLLTIRLARGRLDEIRYLNKISSLKKLLESKSDRLRLKELFSKQKFFNEMNIIDAVSTQLKTRKSEIEKPVLSVILLLLSALANGAGDGCKLPLNEQSIDALDKRIMQQLIYFFRTLGFIVTLNDSTYILSSDALNLILNSLILEEISESTKSSSLFKDINLINIDYSTSLGSTLYKIITANNIKNIEDMIIDFFEKQVKEVTQYVDNEKYRNILLSLTGASFSGQGMSITNNGLINANKLHDLIMADVIVNLGDKLFLNDKILKRLSYSLFPVGK